MIRNKVIAISTMFFYSLIPLLARDEGSVWHNGFQLMSGLFILAVILLFILFLKYSYLKKHANDTIESVIKSLKHPFYIINAETYSVEYSNQPLYNNRKKHRQAKCYNISHNLDAPCNGENHLCPINVVKDTKKPCKLIHEHKIGSEKVFVEVHGFPLFDNDGNVNRVIEYMIDITDIRHKDITLKESEEKYRNLFENLQDLYHLTDLDGKVIMASPSVERITGYTLDDVVGHNIIEFYSNPSDRKRFFDEILKTGFVEQFKMQMKYKNGDIRWVSITARLIKDKDGIPTGVEGLSRDIHKAKLIEEELHKIYKGITHSPASIIITDRNARIEFINPKFSDITGYSENEAIGKTPRILKSGRHSREFYKELWDTILSGNEWSGIFQNKKKNGELYWEQASISPILDEQGEITNFIAVKEDITARKNAEDALRVSESKLRAIFDNALAGITIIDREGKFIYTNELFCKMIGYSSDEMFDLTVNDITYKEDIQDSKVLIEKVVSKESGYINSEKRYLRKDDSYFWGNISGSPVLNQNGDVVNLIAIIIDVTDKKKNEIEIIRRNNFLQTLLDALPSPFYYKNDKLIIQNINNSFEKAFGKTKDQIIGKSFSDLYPADIAESYYVVDNELLTNRGLKIYETKVPFADGLLHDVLMHSTTFQDSTGKVEGIMGIIIDISDIK
ncbi:MAG: hypothetical protein QG635_1191, partial [Bacteroidota bacterium]|nr:hypothetical protein [Bacteroidota bacterium]